MTIENQRVAAAAEVLRLSLERLDPQLPAPDIRARRLARDLEEAGLLGFGRRIEALPAEQVAAWL